MIKTESEEDLIDNYIALNCFVNIPYIDPLTKIFLQKPPFNGFYLAGRHVDGKVREGQSPIGKCMDVNFVKTYFIHFSHKNAIQKALDS